MSVRHDDALTEANARDHSAGDELVGEGPEMPNRAAAWATVNLKGSVEVVSMPPLSAQRPSGSSPRTRLAAPTSTCGLAPRATSGLPREYTGGSAPARALDHRPTTQPTNKGLRFLSHPGDASRRFGWRSRLGDTAEAEVAPGRVGDMVEVQEHVCQSGNRAFRPGPTGGGASRK